MREELQMKVFDSLTLLPMVSGLSSLRGASRDEGNLNYRVIESIKKKLPKRETKK